MVVKIETRLNTFIFLKLTNIRQAEQTEILIFIYARKTKFLLRLIFYKKHLSKKRSKGNNLMRILACSVFCSVNPASIAILNL